MTTAAIPKVLGDTNLWPLRCSHCLEELNASAPVEVHETPDSRWVLVKCSNCSVWTPKQWEKEA